VIAVRIDGQKVSTEAQVGVFAHRELTIFRI
jgi:hypothetical protein